MHKSEVQRVKLIYQTISIESCRGYICSYRLVDIYAFSFVQTLKGNQLSV